MNTDAPLDAFVPEPYRHLEDPARDLPRLAKDPSAMTKIGAAVAQVPTRHRLLLGDARRAVLLSESVHLVLTSPPYWTLKEYRRSEGQLGWVADYDEFLDQLDEVWRLCHRALVPGGRLICVSACCRRRAPKPCSGRSGPTSPGRRRGTIPRPIRLPLRIDWSACSASSATPCWIPSPGLRRRRWRRRRAAGTPLGSRSTLCISNRDCSVCGQKPGVCRPMRESRQALTSMNRARCSTE